MANKTLPPLEIVEIESNDYKKINRRKFLLWTTGWLAGGFGFWKLYHSGEEGGLRWPLRNLNEATDSFWQKNIQNERLAPSKDPVTRFPRINGNIGIVSEVDKSKWRLQVIDKRLEKPIFISYEEITSLPAVTESFEFKCIEGWSEVMTFKGVRFSDFMEAFKVGYRNPTKKEAYAYAGLVSIDEEYYVSMDSKSLLHPQTLLCYEMNGAPLSTRNGFPLRLVSAVNYGVKSIKQVGTISFSEIRPDDYWAEQGYGDYLGL